MQSNLMHLYTGLDVDVFDLQAVDITLPDIAHHLAMQCRFVGACKQHYSVAQHSLYVALRVYQLTRDVTRTRVALLHDASEAYLSDIPRPLKVLPHFQFYRDLEEQVQRRIFQAFDLPTVEDTLVSRVDNEMLAQECHRLFSPPFVPKSTEIPPVQALDFDLAIPKMDVYAVRSTFINAFQYPEALDRINHHISPRITL